MSLPRNIFLGSMALILIFPGVKAHARHIPENLFQELYREINTPFCLYSNRVEGTSLDCENPDPAVFECWQEGLHWDYNQEGILKFLEEIRESNQNYEYYNAPAFNEFLSNRNWDIIFYYRAIC